MDTLVGMLIGLVMSIVANLLTPFMKPLWGKFLALQERGQRAQLQQEIKTHQRELDQLNRFKASERDLYLDLFRWLLGIIALFFAGVVQPPRGERYFPP
jgi:hypothetical protein